jgi:predicted nucleotidyltransferase
MNSFHRRYRSCVRDCCRFVKSTRLVSLKFSVADGTAKPGSDVDLMVTFRPGAKVGTEFLDMISELEELLGGPTRERERCNHGKLDQAESDP